MGFVDYHRTIVGYHGTSRKKAEAIIRNQSYQPSKNNHDWLGHGVYFWEYAPKQALWWAKKRYGADAAVVASMIRLGNCLDLLDPENAKALRKFHDDLESTLAREGNPMPENHNSRKYRDCFVLEAYYAEQAEVDTARGVYVPTSKSASESRGGLRLWPKSWLTLDSHIQICVRPGFATSGILGTWPVTLA